MQKSLGNLTFHKMSSTMIVMDSKTYRKITKILFECFTQYAKDHYRDLEFYKELKKQKEGRTGSSIFDQEITGRVSEDQSKIKEIVDKELSAQNYEYELSLITAPSLKGETRSFYDLHFVLTSKDKTESIDVIVNLKYITGNNNDNVSGGLKLLGYLMSNLSIDQMNDSNDFSNKEKLLKFINSNLDEIKKNKMPKDYFVMNFYKDQSNETIGFNDISYGSILDGGISINSAQTFPGFQLSLANNVWNDNFNYDDVPRIVIEWMKKYSDKLKPFIQQTDDLFLKLNESDKLTQDETQENTLDIDLNKTS